MPKKLKQSKETYIKWYKDMLLIRRFEDKCAQLYLQQQFGGFLHLYNGQEAIVVATASACKEGDKHITAYRDHAHPIAFGMDPKYVMAELFGKTTGCSKGKGGSMHMFDMSRGMMGGHGIVGAQIPMGAGIAFAEKYKGTDNVCVTSFGDGAARQGGLHEAFNMAMLWKLPAIFIIENNKYAMGTSIDRTSNVDDMSKLGLSYDMPSETVNGMNPDDIFEAFTRALSRARKGDGPTLLNIETYRYKGHSMSDPQKYRTKTEMEQYKEIDPITYVLDIIKNNKFLKDSEIDKINLEIEEKIAECVKFAEESPEPEAYELYEDVYKEEYPFLIEY